MGALHGELVGRGDEGQAGELGDLGRGRLGEAWRRVDAGADRRAAEREAIDALQRSRRAARDRPRACPHSPTIPGPSVSGVASCMWVRPILTMSFHASALAAMASCSAFTAGISRCVTLTAAAMYIADGKGVVGRLRHVDMVVGMNRRLAAERRAGELAAAVGDHLVDVHVELGAAARHPYVQRKHVVMLAGQDLVADLDDQLMRLVVRAACPHGSRWRRPFFRMA